MKSIVRPLLIWLMLLGTAYWAISFVLLDGHFTYWTSFSGSTIEASKEKGLFVTDQLQITSAGAGLQNWDTSYTIWTERRYEVKYFGILFHWTFEDPTWRYLHVKPVNYQVDKKWFLRRLIINRDTLDYKEGFTGGDASCCNRIACSIEDEVTVQLHQAWEHDSIVGELTVWIK